MRIGRNPLAASPAPHYHGGRVVAVVITHLPNAEGYHERRREVVRTCLTSLLKNSKLDIDLCVWDNGSDKVTRDWIRNTIHPTYFVESQNIGKNAAMKAAFSMFPAETVIAYSDDDMFFYPDWLAPQLAILTHFPRVACVSGYPVRTAFRWGVDNTMAWAWKNAAMTSRKFISEQYERDFCDSIGRDYNQHVLGTVNDMDYRMVYKGVEAYATAHHCQMVGKAGVLADACKWDNQGMGEQQSFDTRLDKLGLRLCTTTRYTRHMGNVIDDKLRLEIARYLWL